jgi:hypothetical protein
MKRITAFTVFLAALCMSSCLVTSLHPFYKAKDKIYDPFLEGTWIDSDSGIWIIEENKTTDHFMGPERSDSTYMIQYFEEKGVASYMQGTLFELDGVRYLDFFPDPDKDHFSTDLTSFHHVPVHTLARVKTARDTMMFFWHSQEWLDNLLENNRIRIDHERVVYSTYYQTNLLTAETDELQKFIMKYMNDEKTEAAVEHAFFDSKENDAYVFIKLGRYNGPVPGNK